MENSLSLAFGSTAFPAAQGRWILRSKRRRELKKKVALLGIVNASVKPSVCQLPGRGAFWAAQTKSCPHEMGKVAANAMSRRKGNDSKKPSAVRYSPSVFSLSFTDSSPASGGTFWVRFTSSYIMPAMKGEVDASATSRRRGCIGAALIYGNPSVNPPCGVLPAPRPGNLLGAILYAKIYELTPRLEQGRLTHCRS